MPQLCDLVGRRVLVTGASGFLGSRLVAVLSERGCAVHAFIREESKSDHLNLPRVVLFRGDVSDAGSMRSAFEGIDFVIHAAADTRGTKEKGDLATIQGTKNVLDLCSEFKVKKLIYISSCSVYGITDYREGQVVSEESSLERFPEKRGYYSHAKLRAEQLVTGAMAVHSVPIVCLRPGIYFGPGGELFSPMMGFSAGRKVFVIIGMGNLILPLVCIENLVDAIITCILSSQISGRIYNIVEREMPTKRQYVESFLKKLYPSARFLYIPYQLFRGIVRVQEILFGMFNRDPVLTTYRLEASQKRVIYDASLIRRELNWAPPVSLQQAYENVIEYENRQTIGRGSDRQSAHSSASST